MPLHELTIIQTAEGLAKGEFTSIEVTQAYLNRIGALDKNIHAFLTIAPELAMAQAKEADDRRAKGENGTLLGVPLAIKDNMTTVGIRTTAASKILENFLPATDATVIARLKKAGAVILGKTNLDEFAHGASTENSAYGPTKNPWDTSRVPGGSSGGSAAAVAANFCAGALGSDTGGSIRHPASFCGVVGFKTSYGRVSRSGLLSMTSSTDVIGPMTKTIADAASILEVIAGPDELDSTTYPKTPRAGEYMDAVSRRDLTGLKFGLPKEFFVEGGLTLGVKKIIEKSIARVESLGATVQEVSLPSVKHSVPVYYVLTPSEISSNLSRFDGIRFGYQAKEAKNLFEVYAKSRGQGFGPEVKRRIMVGTYALSHGYYDAYYKKAQRVRTLIVQEMEGVLQEVDALLAPASPHVAFKIGEQIDDPLKMYVEDIFMSAASLVGLPSLVMPAGNVLPESGGQEMPVGVQFIGRRFAESDLLGIGAAFEASRGPWVHSSL